MTLSPHKKGTSALLADKFIEGANEAEHEVFRFDAALEDVKSCLACDYCASHDGKESEQDNIGFGGKLLSDR